MINNYRIGKMLGEGCSGEVREVTNTQDNSKCALKIFLNHREMLVNESYHQGQLVHQHIVRQIDANTNAMLIDGDDRVNVGYIATELLPKGELLSYLIGKGGLSAPIVKYYAMQFIDSINYMHRQGIAHRDLKLENVLLDSNFNVKIADFGFACPIQSEN